MTDTSQNLLKPSKSWIGLPQILVACLFLFVTWVSSGIGLSLSPPDTFAAAGSVYEHQERMAEGQSDISQQLMWFAFFLIGGYLHLHNPKRARAIWTEAWPLLVLLGFIILSILWSSVPDIALRRVVKQLLLVGVVAGVVVGASSPREMFRLAVLLTGLFMAMNWASALLVPAVALDDNGAFTGLHGHKNQAGVVAMISTFLWFAAARWSRRTWERVFLYLGALLWFVFLVATNSRTSMISAVLAITFVMPLRYCIQKPMLGVVSALFMLFLGLTGVFVLVMLGVTLSDIFAFLEGDKTTLTGRTLVWQIAYNAFLDNMLLGTGFGSLWQAGGVTPAEQYGSTNLTEFLLGLTQAHSGYFDTLATLGAIGALVFLIFVASAFVALFRAFASSHASQDKLALIDFSGLIFTASLVLNLTQSGFLRSGLLWMFVVLCYLWLCSLSVPEDPQADSRRA